MIKTIITMVVTAIAGLVGYLVSDCARTGKMPVPHKLAHGTNGQDARST